MSTKKNCTTCAYSEFPRNENGRVRRGSSGKCAFQVQVGAVPVSANVRIDRIWVNSSMGEDCPVWLQVAVVHAPGAAA